MELKNPCGFATSLMATPISLLKAASVFPLTLVLRQARQKQENTTKENPMHQPESQVAMDKDQIQSKTFETHYESAIPEPPFTRTEYAFEMPGPKQISFQHMIAVDFANLNAFSGMRNEGFSWDSEDSSNYFASHASGPPDDAQLSPLATSAERSRVPWIAPAPANEHLDGNGSCNVEGWPRCSKPESCNTLVLRTLKTLHIATEECLSRSENETFEMSRRDSGAGATQGRRVRTMDAVLPQIKDALATTTTIIRCSCSCIQRIQLQILVANVLEKLVSWCGAVVRSMSTNTGTDDRDRREEVSRQSLTIGTHQLDNALEVQVIAQVVTGKLQKLEGLVEELGSRTEGANIRRDGNMSTKVLLREAGLLQIIRDRLTDCLKCQIGVLRGDLTRLRVGNSPVL